MCLLVKAAAKLHARLPSLLQGSGEVSSANYIAREYGVRAGMFMAEAKRRCPDLIVLPYEVWRSHWSSAHMAHAKDTMLVVTEGRLDDTRIGVAQYEKYEDAAEQVYRILLKQSAAVQMLSCDEAFVDVSGLGEPEEIAAAIRAQVSLLIASVTHCQTRYSQNLIVHRLSCAG